jgi:hypothetical protein
MSSVRREAQFMGISDSSISLEPGQQPDPTQGSESGLMRYAVEPSFPRIIATKAEWTGYGAWYNIRQAEK